MDERAHDAQKAISAMELIAILGFSLNVGWMLVTFYWLFCDFPPGIPIGLRDFSQMWVFLGIPAGYILLHFLGRNPKFNLFSAATIGAVLIFGSAIPVASIAMRNGGAVPLELICAFNFLAGAAGAALKISWLDVSSRLHSASQRYGRFVGLSFAGGGVLFVMASISPEQMQPLFAFVYLLCSIGLLVFSTERADGNDDRAPLESIDDTWKFSKEVEPSLLMFGIVFGLTFVYLFNFGTESVFIGFLFMFPGALLIAALSAFNHEIGIISTQRIVTCIAVFGCIATPFTDGWLQLGCACIVMIAWAMLTVQNNAFITKKSVLSRETPLFRQAPLRLVWQALGFAIGWIAATVVTMAFGAHSDAFTAIRLTTAIALVVVIMVFLPVERHHANDGTTPTAPEQTQTVVSVSLSEQELFEARCAAVSKMYQLSPRESDTLRYLAKGRNAAYIQEVFTISPHTVKSHIYNIYRKLDIHSQQKLMDFIEQFPVDMTKINEDADKG